MTYKLWDKQTPIYDVTPEQAIKNNPLYGSEDSYLFFNENGSIYDILPISTLRMLTEPDESATADEVCEKFIETLASPEQPQGGEASEDVIALKKEVEELKTELTAAKILLGVD